MGRKDEKSRRAQQRVKKKGDGEVQMDPEEEYKGAPHTFVINRGSVGKNVTQLIRDMRRVMEPFTASHLKTNKKNVLKDFVNVAGVLNVSHMMLFTKNENGTNLRVVRTPRGPTLTFHVEYYTLGRDVVSSLKRPNMEARQFLHHPLLVMNNFSGEGRELQLMSSMFQNMFPSINVNKVKLNSIRRCVLLNYNSEDKLVEFRHYNIKAVPVGMSRGIKKLIKAKVPNLERFDDVSEFLLKGGELSESEAELDGPHNEVVLPQDVGSRGNIKSSKSAIRLTEIGPRLTLKLVKIEEGVCDGPVLFHEYRSLSADDIKYMQTKRALKKDMKDRRKQAQAENVKRKADEKERLKQLSLDGMKKKAEADAKNKSGDGEEKEDGAISEDGEIEDPETALGGGSGGESEDDDAAYFRKEVGKEPDADMQLSKCMKRKRSDRPKQPFKKRNMGSDKSGDGKFNKGDKFDKKGKLDKKAKFGTFGKKEKFDKTDKFDKFGKKGKYDNDEKFDKFGKRGKPDKNENFEKFGKKGKFDKKGGKGAKFGRKGKKPTGKFSKEGRGKGTW